MNVIVFMTLGGQEVLAELVSQNDTTLVVSKPRSFIISQAANGNMQASLVPYLSTAPDRKDIPISKYSITTWYDADEDLVNSYLKATSTLQLLS